MYVCNMSVHSIYDIIYMHVHIYVCVYMSVH